MKYQSRVVKINVFPMSEVQTLFGKNVTEVELDDEGGGEYITLTQNERGNVAFNDIDELMAVVEAVKTLLVKPKDGVHNG